MTAAEPAARPLRADAQRNYDALLAAGAEVFAREGHALVFEDVAKAAGLGKGTLYRHFPTREHLLAALLTERFDALAAEAETLRADADALAAVEEWLRSFDRLPTGFRGLSAQISSGLSDESSAVSAACRPMKAGFGALLRRAQREGSVVDDVDPVDLLSMVAALPEHTLDENGQSRYLEIVLRGIRAS